MKHRNFIKLLVTLRIAISVLSVQAQNWCSIPEISIQSTVEDSFNNYVITYKQSQEYLSTQVKIIPTVIHIIYRNNADSIKMGMTRIQNVINKCNEQLRRLNADAVNTRAKFKGVAADCHIQVCLATKKPNSSSFSGIIYHSKPNWDSFNDYAAFVKTNMLDRTKYLNVFVVPDEESGGAIFPWDANNTADGFFVGSKLFGVYNSDLEDWGKEGTTFVHELAHYLGVYHTFHNSTIYLGRCELANDSTIGDKCADTPLDWDLPLSADQCTDGNRLCDNSSLNFTSQTENYMYYNRDSCTNMFSRDQRARMRACLSSFRSSLVTASNLIFTGVMCNPLLSISEPFMEKDIILYPNPTHDIISIKHVYNNNIQSVRIFDNVGRLVIFSKNSNTDTIVIGLEQIVAGIYFVEIVSNDTRIIKKLVKN